MVYKRDNMICSIFFLALKKFLDIDLVALPFTETKARAREHVDPKGGRTWQWASMSN